MPKGVINLREERPLLDIVSHARGGRGLTPQEREQILLTVRRVPEVMVKVSGGAHTLAGVRRHMKYIGRDGDLGMETDMGAPVGGDKFERDLAEDWDLDLEALGRQSQAGTRKRQSGKLVHNIIFSMPAGTPSQKVLRAVRKLALNEWQLRHRYAMALHTDTSHPHVHVVLKAMSEQGPRLNIRKSTLRGWRAQFAANLRELGVAANATERAVRGETRISKSDGMFRMSARGHIPVPGLRQDHLIPQRGQTGKAFGSLTERMRRTRIEVVEAWLRTAAVLRARGDTTMADLIRAFVGHMKPALDEQQPTAKVDSGLGRNTLVATRGRTRE